ncbi:MAG: hypothetical protein Tsb0034_05640 [Ekhidna sp.]
MRKSFYAFVLSLVALFVIPACSTADDLDEVIEPSELDVTASTDDDEDIVAKPGTITN